MHRLEKYTQSSKCTIKNLVVEDNTAVELEYEQIKSIDCFITTDQIVIVNYVSMFFHPVSCFIPQLIV